MKAVVLAGGLGTRLSEETDLMQGPVYGIETEESKVDKRLRTLIKLMKKKTLRNGSNKSSLEMLGVLIDEDEKKENSL